jgi:hypothetical protein
MEAMAMDLDVLVGRWKMEMANGPHVKGTVRGEATFEWLDGGGYLVVRTTVDAPEFPNSVAVIGPREGSDEIVQHYFDTRGVARIYSMSLDAGEWRLWRDAPEFSQRCVLKLEGDVMRGAWEMARDGTTFVKDFDITYTRVS